MQRSARSTLAAEANAADEASDRLAFCNYFCTELFYQIPAYKGTMKMEMKQATDAKSLYDLLIAENPAPLEKRSMVAVRSVQQTLPAQAIHWLPTNIMHADGLTKLDMRLQQALATWCMAPWCQLREEHSKPAKAFRCSVKNKDQCEDSTSDSISLLP